MTQASGPRYAIYFTPSPASALASFGASVIGYDPHGGNVVRQMDLSGVTREELIAATRAPRRYGFHATLVAPFYLNDCGEAHLREGVKAFCRQAGPVALGRLELRALARFIALVPAEHRPDVVDLAARCVEFFERYRAVLGADDRTRRDTGGLSTRQRQYLDRWGYPYVLEEFRFHMTLTGPLAAPDTERFCTALSDAYHSIAADAHAVDAISLLRQNDLGASFKVIERCRLDRRHSIRQFDDTVGLSPKG